jgi:hypothetical protein
MASPPAPTLHPGFRAYVEQPWGAFSRRGIIFHSALGERAQIDGRGALGGCFQIAAAA